MSPGYGICLPEAKSVVLRPGSGPGVFAAIVTVQHKGKIFFGLIGLFIGDSIGLPFGALIGFFAGSLLGYFLIDRPLEQEAGEAQFRAFQRRQGEFLHHVISLCAKLAKADGTVNRSEVNHMERLMRYQFRLSDANRAYSIRVWNDVKNSPDPFDAYARAFYRDFGRERHHVLNMMDLLFAMSASDGGLHPREEELLLRAAGIFHISRMQFDRIKSRYYQMPPGSASPRWSPLDPYYAILGAQPGESMDAIKKKFRALAFQWHPDQVASRNTSPDALRHAKEKFQQINEAYEKIADARKSAK